MRLWPKRRRFPLGACAALIIAGVFLGVRTGCAAKRPTADWSSSPLVEGDYEVARVVAGDRIAVRRRGESRGRVFPVHLLGIALADRRFEKPAREFLQSRLAGGGCRLEFDKRRLDGEGAFLAYLFVGDALLNEELVREGLARAATEPDDSPPIARRLANAERQAKAAGRGMWSERD